MPRHEIHAEDCQLMLDNPCEEVHAWLDGLAGLFPPPYWGLYHRSFRHNSYGLAYCQARWGSLGEMAFRIHLVRDRDDAVKIRNYPLKGIVTMSNKALLFFNNLENFEVYLWPSVLNAWKGHGLVHIAQDELDWDAGRQKKPWYKFRADKLLLSE